MIGVTDHYKPVVFQPLHQAFGNAGGDEVADVRSILAKRNDDMRDGLPEGWPLPAQGAEAARNLRDGAAGNGGGQHRDLRPGLALVVLALEDVANDTPEPGPLDDDCEHEHASGWNPRESIPAVVRSAPSRRRSSSVTPTGLPAIAKRSMRPSRAASRAIPAAWLKAVAVGLGAGPRTSRCRARAAGVTSASAARASNAAD